MTEADATIKKSYKHTGIFPIDITFTEDILNIRKNIDCISVVDSIIVREKVGVHIQKLHRNSFDRMLQLLHRQQQPL
jgi:hypothetical protein